MNITEKWKPLLEYSNIDADYYDEVAAYAEMFTINEVKRIQLTGDKTTLLPLNLKIISKLDLKKVNFVGINDDVNVYNFKDKIDTKENKIEVEDIEEFIVNKISNYINNKRKVNVYEIVNSMSVEEVTKNHIFFSITSRLKTSD